MYRILVHLSIVKIFSRVDPLGGEAKNLVAYCCALSSRPREKKDPAVRRGLLKYSMPNYCYKRAVTALVLR